MVLPLTQLVRSIFEYSFAIFFFKSQLSGRAFNRYTERSILVGRTRAQAFFLYICFLFTFQNELRP